TATLTSKGRAATETVVPFGAIFKRALILSLTNPKAILFYVSFFVQFIDVTAPHTGVSFFILATTLEIVSFCYLSFLILSGAFVTHYIGTKKKLAKVGNSLIGLLFVGFAARLATLQS
ncbi:LysE family transporter, partial [Salmonella enterica]|nr:LysE family transporter [Salmonella enterica]